MMKFVPAVLVCCLLPCVLWAQEVDADRPSEGQSAAVVRRGSLQSEIGFKIEQQKEDDHQYEHPNAVFRYGLLDRLELRLYLSAETQRFYSKQQYAYGLMPVEVGAKGILLQTKDTGFTASIYGMLGLPQLASKDHQHGETFYRLRLLFQNEFSDKVKLNYNLGREWDSEERQQNWMYSVSPQLRLSGKWEAFVEEYAYLHKSSRPEHYIDAGLACQVSNDIKVDVNAGKGLSSNASDYFINTGVSFRLHP